MLKPLVRLALFAPLCLCPGKGFSQGVTDCNSALVMSTYSRLDLSHTDWRAASLVTDKEWNEVSHKGDANAVIYGIPMGASYSDYQKRVTDKLNSYQESLTLDEKTNVIWTGLDPNGKDAYTECLKTTVLNQDGLHAYVYQATKDQVSLRIRWNPKGSEHLATPQWTWEGPGKARLPRTLQPGFTTVILPRPKTPQLISANFNGSDTSLTITSYPPPPHTAKITFVSCVEVHHSPVAVGWGKNFSEPMSFCTPVKPEGWTITRLVDFHTSDLGTERGCGHFATCYGQDADVPTRICRNLSVQGHDENRFDGYGRLQGFMTVEWKQPLKGDEDPKKLCTSD